MSSFEGPDWSLIGNAFEILITELLFSGDTAVTDPPVAEAKTAYYYNVTVPLETRSWQLGVNVIRGDWLDVLAILSSRCGKAMTIPCRGRRPRQIRKDFLVERWIRNIVLKRTLCTLSQASFQGTII